MSFSANRCSFCNETVPNDELWAHMESVHSGLKPLTFISSGQTMDFVTFVNTFEECPYEPTEKDLQMDIPPAPVDIYFDLGLSHDEMRVAPHDNIGDGGKFSTQEWTLMLSATGRLGGTGFKLDRNRFIASLIRHLLVEDSSPRVDDSGSVTIYSQSFVDAGGFEGAVATEEVTWSKVLAAWSDALGSKSRKATFRRAARSLAPQMMTQIQTANSLQDLRKNGTPLSHKFSIPAAFYYTAVSFFPAIKDPGSWDADERRYNNYRVRNTIVEGAKATPFDNRPGLGSTDQEHSLASKVIRDHEDRIRQEVPKGLTTKDLMRFVRGQRDVDSSSE